MTTTSFTSQRYKSLCIRGAEQMKLDKEYIAYLKSQPVHERTFVAAVAAGCSAVESCVVLLMVQPESERMLQSASHYDSAVCVL